MIDKTWKPFITIILVIIAIAFILSLIKLVIPLIIICGVMFIVGLILRRIDIKIKK